MKGLTIALNDAPFSPPSRVTWTIRFPEADYTMRYGGRRWELVSSRTAADVTITTTPATWAQLLMSTTPDKPIPTDLEIEGDSDKVEQFLAVFQGDAGGVGE